MKNRWLALLIAVLVISMCGCTNINKLDYEDIAIESSKKHSKTNVAVGGYNLFLSRGMTLVNDSNNNLVLYSSGRKFYFYVDLISYYNKKNNSYINTQDGIYNETFSVNGKDMKIFIKEHDDKYYLVVCYNYAKIEVVTDQIKEDLSKSVLVLNNIKYNDTIVESLVGNSNFDYNEEQFNLDVPSDRDSSSSNNSQFLQYEEDYGNYTEDIPDEDKIDVKNQDN